ncbi:MAG: winged helix-turn-helix domain-containing protein [Defluviitaleaceae bacterium]|nr:winged helix-turn-helix domain-containing protein [Defluviitaleaceae bacterium]
MKILIQHKDPTEREKLCEILTIHGYQTTTNAQEATDMILQHREPSPKKTTFTQGDLTINFQSREVTENGREVHLTPIEFKILSLLSKNQNTVLSHEQIISEIWGPFNSDNLVLRVNIANIRRKIEPDLNNPIYILTAMGVGYYMKKI